MHMQVSLSISGPGARLLKTDRVGASGTYVGKRGPRLEMHDAQDGSGQQVFHLRRDVF